MLDKRRSTPWSPNWQADATTFESSAIADCSRPARPRALSFQKILTAPDRAMLLRS